MIFFGRCCKYTLKLQYHFVDLEPSSVKALRKLSTSYEATMDTAKPLTARLSHWYQSLPPSLSVTQLSNKKHELNSHGALHLAHITARVELFRAMMRPKVVEGVSPSAGALRNGAMAVAKDALSFLESLDASHLEAFWPSCKPCQDILKEKL